MSKNLNNDLSRRSFLKYTGTAVIGASMLGKNEFANSNGPHYKPETGMLYRRLGKTELMISEICLGNASISLSQQLGPFLFKKWLRDRGAIINKLLDLGGNIFSTDEMYHNTIELLGEAVKHRQKEVYFAIGLNPRTEPEMRSSLEKALKQLYTETIDLAFLHASGNDESFEALRKFRQEGKVRFIGMSCHDPRMHTWAIKKGYVDWIHIPYNRLSRMKQGPIDLPGTESVLKLAKENDVGVIVIKPMTGNFIPHWAKETVDPEVQEIMKKLKNYGPENLYQAMLKWILQNPNVASCAVGMDTVQQVVENVEAVKTRKLSVVQQELLDMYANHADKDYCRMCETCSPSCPQGIPIPDILRFRMYYKNYGQTDRAKYLYNKLTAHQKATGCNRCGICEEKCPNKLSIVKKLQEAHSILESNKVHLS